MTSTFSAQSGYYASYNTKFINLHFGIIILYHIITCMSYCSSMSYFQRKKCCASGHINEADDDYREVTKDTDDDAPLLANKRLSYLC